MVVGSFSELVLSIAVSKIVSKFVPPSRNETAIESTADKIITRWARKSQRPHNNAYPELLHDHLDGVAQDSALWFSLFGTGDQRHVEAKDAYSGCACGVVN